MKLQLLIGAMGMCALISLVSTATAADRAGRPMLIHRLNELGLEVWTEQDPQWETRVQQTNGVPIFIADTPALSYPPASMSWISLPQFKFETHELELAARGAIDQVAANHGVQAPNPIAIEPQRYGELIGFESTFKARSEQVPIDVRVFFGHRPGKPAVLMQVSTLRTKLPHLSEHIRRAWTHVRYLD